MDIDKIAFCSLAFGDHRYLEQIDRLEGSIKTHYENPNLFFYRNSYPKTSQSFDDSFYGFKVHVIQEAIDAGFKKIIWFDPAMILMQKNLDYYDAILENHPVIAIKDDHKLKPFINERCKNYFGINDEWLVEKDAHLLGGSFYYFDFDKDFTKKVFTEWKDAEANGIFGNTNQHDVGNHRMDETCLSVCLYKNGSSPLKYSGSRYNWDENPILTKQHFK